MDIKWKSFTVINIHRTQQFAFRVVFHICIIFNSLGLVHTNWCCALILHHKSRNYINTLHFHAWHHETFRVVLCILEDFTRIGKTIFPGAVILVLYLIKYLQELITKSRNTLVGIFLQCWFIPEIKGICKPISTKSINLKSTPLYFYVILILSAWLPWKPIVC